VPASAEKSKPLDDTSHPVGGESLMLTVVTSLIGFLGGFIPTLLKLFQEKEDHKHELEILKIQAELQAQGHKERLEEIKTTSDAEIAQLDSQADLEESKALYASMQIPTSGNKFFDGLLNFYNATVRPTVTYSFVIFYWFTKIAQYKVLQQTNQDVWSNVKDLYSEFDQAALILVLSYYFGQRQARWAFGRLKM